MRNYEKEVYASLVESEINNTTGNWLYTIASRQKSDNGRTLIVLFRMNGSCFYLAEMEIENIQLRVFPLDQWKEMVF